MDDSLSEICKSFTLRICNTSDTTLNRKLCHDPSEFVRLPNSFFRVLNHLLSILRGFRRGKVHASSNLAMLAL